MKCTADGDHETGSGSTNGHPEALGCQVVRAMSCKPAVALEVAETSSWNQETAPAQAVEARAQT